MDTDNGIRHRALGYGQLHGQFSRDLEPALVIDSGESVLCQTPDVMWGLQQHGESGTERARAPKGHGPHYDGPAMFGPIAVREARPDDTLEVQILDLEPAEWGWTFAGSTGLNDQFLRAVGLEPRDSALIRWSVDRAQARAISELGLSLDVRPFLGIVGLCPAGDGWHSAWPPRRTGGNMDCRELVAGSSLFLPIESPGGLLSVGDGHLAQGDGEIAGSAIECPMTSITLRLIVHRYSIKQPYAVTPCSWVGFGFGETLDAASVAAVSGLLDSITARCGVTRAVALAVASPICSLRVTQVCNGTVGVHALIPISILEASFLAPVREDPGPGAQ